MGRPRDGTFRPDHGYHARRVRSVGIVPARVVQHAILSSLGKPDDEVRSLARQENGFIGLPHRRTGEAVHRHLPHRQRVASAVTLDPGQLVAGLNGPKRRRCRIEPVQAHVHRLAGPAIDQPPTLERAGPGVGELRFDLAVDAGEAAIVLPPPIIVEALDPAGLTGCTGEWPYGYVILVPRAFDHALAVQAAVFELLEKKHALRECPPALVFQENVDITGRDHCRDAVAGDDQRARHPASDLDEAGTVLVRMVPEGARRMIRRDLIFVAELLSGMDRDQDVVAVAGRRDPQPMGVQVGVVEANMAAALRRSAWIELIIERDSQLLAGRNADRRRDEIAGLFPRTDIGAEFHLVVAKRPRVVDDPPSALNREMIFGCWRGGCHG